VNRSRSFEDPIKEIAAEAEKLGLIVFSGPLEVFGSGFIARGEEEYRWHAFLQLGTTLGVDVIYVGTTTLGELEARSPNGDLKKLIEIKGDWEPAKLTIGYVHGGVAHIWTDYANWMPDAEGAESATDRRFAATLQELRERAREEKWTAELLGIPAFCMVDRSVRCDIAYGFLREKGIVTTDEDLALDHLVDWLVYSTTQSVLEMKDVLIDRAVDDVPAMAMELAASNPDWYGLREAVQERKASRLIAERLGYAVPQIVKETARWKPTESRDT
jgi:hypothetical protein